MIHASASEHMLPNHTMSNNNSSSLNGAGVKKQVTIHSDSSSEQINNMLSNLQRINTKHSTTTYHTQATIKSKQSRRTDGSIS